MQPARAPARKTAQRGVGASSGTWQTVVIAFLYSAKVGIVIPIFSAVESVSALLPRSHVLGAPSEATAPLNVSPLDMKLRRKISTGARHVTPAAPEQALARKCRTLFGKGGMRGKSGSSRALAVGFWTVRRLLPHATPTNAATASRRKGTRRDVALRAIRREHAVPPDTGENTGHFGMISITLPTRRSHTKTVR